jgi:hypothetical protein
MWLVGWLTNPCPPAGQKSPHLNVGGGKKKMKKKKQSKLDKLKKTSYLCGVLIN